MSTIKQFVQNYIGKKYDYDGYYKNQCVDLTYLYMDKVFGKIRNTKYLLGDGKENYKNMGFYGFNSYTGISKNNKPKRGDVISFGATSGNSAGHVAIVLAADDNGIYVLEQNAGNGNGDGIGNNAITIRKKSYNNILGVARYNNIQNKVNEDNFDKIVYEKGYYIWEATNYLKREDVVKRVWDYLSGGKKVYKNGKCVNYTYLGITSNLNNAATREELAYIILAFLNKVRGIFVGINVIKTFYAGKSDTGNLTGEDFTNMINKTIKLYGTY